MLRTASAMTDQVVECSMNNTLLFENAFSANAVKEEEIKDEDFVDDKVHITETTIITEVQNKLILDQIKHYDTSATLSNIKTEITLPETQYNMIQDNLKTEEGVATENIKIEFNNGLLYCEDCQVYFEDYCIECEMLVHIMNKTIPINADNKLQEQLPNNVLEIHDYFGECRIFALKIIPVGVKFGPFTGLYKTERSWKIKGGKFAVNKEESKYLNWMQYIHPAKNISEQNLHVFQYEQNIYYETTRQVEGGDELLVYFGEEFENSLNRNVEKNFIPMEHIFKDEFACTFCCFGFSSKSYLAKHKSICPGNVGGGFTIEELTQCPFCKINMDHKEYILHHMAYCSKTNDRKCILPTTGEQTVKVPGRRTRPCQMCKCQQCKYRTKYKGDLRKHTNQHCEVKTYKCGICCRRFKTKEVLRLHADNTHICAGLKDDLEHSTEVYMKVHIKAEHSSTQNNTKQFKCSICQFGTKYKANLKSHVRTKHLKEFKYRCGICHYKTNWKSNLKIHIESRHLKEFKHKCGTCHYQTNRRDKLQAHIEAKHMKEFKYKCDTCDYKSNRKSVLKMHTETRHLKKFKYYKCGTCDYRTNRKDNLQTHIETRHLKEFKYKCDSCDYQTNRKYNLQAHIETRHLKEFKYKCDTCNYETNQKCILKMHIETKHLKEFKHKCDTCDYRTNRKDKLQIHINTRHLKEFKYKCDTCDYKSNQKSILTMHIETKHLKEFKYKCDTCVYQTNRKDNLQTHVETRHLKEFKYKCDACDYKTHRKDYLKRHTEKRHSKELKYA